MANDPFKHKSGDVQSPFRTAHAVTYGVDFGFVSRGIHVGSAGNVSVVMADGATAVFKGLAAGATLDAAATQITSAGSTVAAADLLALL